MNFIIILIIHSIILLLLISVEYKSSVEYNNTVNIKISLLPSYLPSKNFIPTIPKHLNNI